MLDATSGSRHFGSGWISGVISVFLGALGFGAVLCLLFPQYLTMPELRAVYPMPMVRKLIQLVLVAAFVMGFISVVLRRNKVLGLTGLSFTTVAVVLGGSQVPVSEPVPKSNYLGLDWFLLELFFLALIFVPLEQLFGRLREQGVFRFGWRIDMAHFAVSHLAVQLTVFLSMLPAKVLFAWAISARLQQSVASQPLWVQFLEILMVADLAEYWTHRTMHRIPFLWKFHAVHHSSRHLDWLAASRNHVLDTVVIRAVTFIPLFVLGFTNQAIFAYLLFVTFHALFIHANVNFRFGWLDWVIATPRFHHWHHGIDAVAVDKNFATHLPAIDMLFRTCHLPRKGFPTGYGIAGHPVPENYVQQVVYPFLPEEKLKSP
jgi:lathosterol oxidase